MGKRIGILAGILILAMGGMFAAKKYMGDSPPAVAVEDEKADPAAPGTPAPSKPVGAPAGTKLPAPAASAGPSSIIIEGLADLLTYKETKGTDFEVNESGRPAHFSLKKEFLDDRQKAKLAAAVTDENRRDGLKIEPGDIEKTKFVLSNEGDRIKVIHVSHYGKDKTGADLIPAADKDKKVALTILAVNWDRPTSESWITDTTQFLAADPKLGPPDRGGPHVRHLDLVRSRFLIVEKK